MKQPAKKLAAVPQPYMADPVTVEIVRLGVMAVTDDMKADLGRSIPGAAAGEAMDIAAGLFTPDGETVSAALAMPLMMRGMAEAVKAAIRRFGADGLKPGDICITNDPTVTGAGLGHVTVALPVFHKDALAGFTACVARWPDIGGVLDGVLGGMTADIFSEGLQFPLLKYQDRGKVNQDLVDIIRLNVRHPDRALAVLHAQVTAVTTGERRFLDLIARHGRDAVAGAIAAVMERAEAAARARVQAIPDGEYEAESFLDDDGVTAGRMIPVRVRVAVKGDEMTIDLTDMSRQVRGFYNSGAATGHASAQAAFRGLIAPADEPVSDGTFRNLTIILPPGRVVSASRPAPVRSWMTVPMTIVDTIVRALAPALPDHVIAGHHADQLIARVHGFNARTQAHFGGSLGPLGGGWGAGRSNDGVSGAAAVIAGDICNPSNEAIEARFPLVVERYALVPDSGGAGRRRGGLGVERVVRARTDITLSTEVARALCRPWGLNGGRDGHANAVALRINAQWKTDISNVRMLTAQIKAGDAFRLRSGGGGGYGPPLDRPLMEVLNDVRQGYVSAHEAGVFYGVVMDPATGRVNEPATVLIRGAGLPLLPPPERDGLLGP
jgi:N-methylhydantoinase B